MMRAIAQTLLSQLRGPARRLQLQYWRLRKPVTVGARAIVVDPSGRVVLVRHSYTTGWYLPGGGVTRGEAPDEAVCRELQEEIGVAPAQLRLYGVYTNRSEGKTDHVVVFVATIDGQLELVADGSEVIAVQAFCPAELPSDCSPGTRRRVQEYFGEPDASRYGVW